MNSKIFEYNAITIVESLYAKLRLTVAPPDGGADEGWALLTQIFLPQQDDPLTGYNITLVTLDSFLQSAFRARYVYREANWVVGRPAHSAVLVLGVAGEGEFSGHVGREEMGDLQATLLSKR